MSHYFPESEDIFLSLVDVDLKIRSDIMATSGHTYKTISE